jgi:hypothetical protein
MPPGEAFELSCAEAANGSAASTQAANTRDFFMFSP